MALQLAPLLEHYQTTYLEIAGSLHIADDDVLTARSDLIWSEMMDEVSAAAEWPRSDGFFVRMVEVIWPHADDEKVGRWPKPTRPGLHPGCAGSVALMKSSFLNIPSSVLTYRLH